MSPVRVNLQSDVFHKSSAKTQKLRGRIDMTSSRRASSYSIALFVIFGLSGSAMAGVPTQAEMIPTLSEWGFIIMGICLLSLSVRALLRRNLPDSR